MRSVAVERVHAFHGGFNVRRISRLSFERRRDQSHAQRFGQHQQIARLRAALRQNVRRMHQARHGQTVLRFFVADRMPASDDGSGLAHFLRAAAQNLSQDRAIQIVGERRQIQRE